MTLPTFAIPLSAKPPYGAPCTSCGVCCNNRPCPVGRQVFGLSRYHLGTCPALEQHDGRFLCGIIRRPLHYAPQLRRHGASKLAAAAKLLVAAGLGCDQPLDATAEAHPAFDEARAAYSRAHRRAFPKARRLWGMGT